MDVGLLRFWTKVEKTLDDCWLWTGAKCFGYGTFQLDGKAQRAHRVIWLWTKGQIPERLLVCHKCDVRNCVNPEHLFLGTYLDNNRDRKEKGRGATGDRNGARLYPERLARGDANPSRRFPERLAWGAKNHMRQHPEKARGEANANAILTAAQVAEIRRVYRPRRPEAERDAFAASYGVCTGTIYRIMQRKIWL